MIKQSYRLHLTTPAFLGDAEQKGVWRTPPLKALIREWWRVAVAAECSYDVSRIKARETALFGTAADDSRDGNQKSRIRLALERWNIGKMREHDPLPAINHPEAERANHRVEPLNYLGYGPIDRGRFKNGPALQAGEQNDMKIAHPAEYLDQVREAVTLAQWFGTIGGRGRNAWGSLLWTASNETASLSLLSRNELHRLGCVRTLKDCLTEFWPHAIGVDRLGPLIWLSQGAFKDWRDAMTFLARTKIDFRHNLGFVGGQPHREPQPRHMLAYPVTNHSVRDWGNNVRIANTLRFKVHREADGTLRALIYHTPCKPTLPHAGIDLLDTWQRVHRFLDAQPTLARLA